MTNEQNIILQKYLRGVEEFKHSFRRKSHDNSRYCLKCTSLFKKDRKLKPCPIPDPLRNKDGNIASEADIAEEIRAWVATTKAKNMPNKYMGKLKSQWKVFCETKHLRYFTPLGEWTALDCTPAQKIQAFCDMMKETKNDKV